MALAGLSACSSPSSPTPTIVGSAPTSALPGGATAPAAPVAGTGGQLIPIQSDNVQSAGYDAATQTMTVLFNSGGLYEYYGVPASLWEDFIAAQPHPWSQVGYPRLVEGGVAYKRIG